MPTESTVKQVVLLSLVSAVLCFASTSSRAHQQKTAITEVLFNPNTENIEVMHRLYLHDAEHAATLLFGNQLTLLESAQTRELFSSYIRGRFAIQVRLANGSSRELPLSYVGEEVDGQFFWVYQEVPDSEDIVGLSIVNLILRDVWPDQANLVNIERGDSIQSLGFTEATEVLNLDLP